MKKNTITACLCLALSVAIMIYTGHELSCGTRAAAARMGTQCYRGEDAF